MARADVDYDTMKSCIRDLVLMLAMLIPAMAWADSFHRFHFDNRNGLSSNYVRNIAQDAHGFVYIATIDGLNRFDGLTFTHFTKEASGLPTNEINCLLPDPTNPDILWIATRHGGLCRYDYSTCSVDSFAGGLRTADVPHLSPASGGGIWVTNYHSVADLLDPVTSRVTPLFDKVPRNFPRPVWCNVESPDGRYLYTGTVGQGLTQTDLRTRRFTTYRPDAADPAAIAGSTVYCIYVEDTGGVWAGTDRGLSLFDPRTRSFTNIYSDGTGEGLLPGAVKCIRRMSDGSLWFGTSEGGVSILPADRLGSRDFRFEHLLPFGRSGESSDIASADITAIFEDSYGNRWLGNLSDGVDVISYAPPFFSVSQPFANVAEHKTGQAVWSATTDAGGALWLGGDDEIVEFDRYPRRHVLLPTAPLGYKAAVRALMVDDRGRIWAGTHNSGLYIYDSNLTDYTCINLPYKEIRSIMADRDGNVLVGTNDGLFSVNANTFEVTPMTGYNNVMEDRFVMCMTRDSDGKLRVGTMGCGIHVFSPDGQLLRIIDTKASLPTNTVSALTEDSRGNMWVATRNGAVRMSIRNASDIHVYGIKDGLVGGDVKSIAEDRSGNIWLGTNRGIALYMPQTDKISVYGRTYSHRLDAFAESASTVTGDGRIYLGSLYGLVDFNPKEWSEMKNEDNIVITGIKVNDSQADDQNLQIEIPITSDRIVLPYNNNTFTISFGNLDITCAANTDYMYNLKGLSEVWTEVSGKNEVMYRNLNPGKYEFRVRYRINGDEWSEPLTVAYITVEAPWYATWWAKVLYVLLAAVVLFVVIYFYKRKLNLEKNLAIERENINNVRNLNEERLIFFTNITHELRTPLSLIIGPIEDLVNDPALSAAHRKRLLTIRTSSMRLLNLINGILEFRKTETRNRKLEVVHGDLANLVRENGLRFKELNNNPDVSIVIDVARMEGVEMYYDPEMITTIINNLMGNATKYTRSGTVTLSLSPVTVGGIKYVDLAVSDTGEGIASEALPHIFERYYQASNSRKTSGTGIGLALTRNLVELHEGVISVESVPGNGSTFRVRLLLENSYPGARHREIEEPQPEAGYDRDNGAAGDDCSSRLVLLLVEDDNDVRDYIAGALSDEFRVMTAANGREGYDVARAEIPDIVVSDIMMPEMDGIELCHRLKTEPATNHIPVILLTAKDSISDKEAGYESGADSYITKPFSSTLLRARIVNIIESRHRMSLRLLDIPSYPAAAADTSLPAPVETPQDAVPEKRREASGDEVRLSKFDKEFLDKFRRLVEDNMEMEEFDQTFLADRMCMSHSTLYRKVKSVTGLTPNEFIRRIKLNKVCELIVDDSLSMADIAQMAGFSSAAYFRRVFKKEFGVSPTEYKQGITGRADNTTDDG